MKKTPLLFIFLFCFLSGGLCGEYVIGPQDVLDITVWKEDSLTKAYTVDDSGNITMPFLKEVEVSGLTAKEAAELIAGRLKSEGYLIEPRVTVLLKDYRSHKVMVFGMVKKPGEYYLRDKTMVLDLLHQIEYAENEGGKMVITRKDSSDKEETIEVDLDALLLNGDLSQNTEILSGDSVIISPKAATQQADVPGSEGYVIGTDDVLDIVTWKDDNLTKTVAVDKDGNISLPYLNKVRVTGLTTRQATDLIAKRLKEEGYLVNPVVTVTVKEYRSQKIMVFGMIKKPGAYYLKDKTLVLDLLTQIEQTGEEIGRMVILRKKTSGEEETISVDLHALVLNGDLSQNIEILGGDKIIVSESIAQSQQVYVLGEVKTPGPYKIEQDMSVLEALRMAGGFTDFANKAKVKLIREENGKKKNIIISLDKIRKGDKSQDVTLQAGDVLVALKSWF